MNPRRPNGPVLFAELTLVAATTALVGVVAYAFAADPPAASEATAATGEPADTADVVDLDDGAVADPDADVTQIVSDAATAMADVTSVEFRLDRSGAPIFIDPLAPCYRRAMTAVRAAGPHRT